MCNFGTGGNGKVGRLMEIIIFALISTYLFYKLWTILGQESDEDDERRERRRSNADARSDTADNVVPLHRKDQPFPFSKSEEDEEADLKPGAREGLRQLRLQEPEFSLSEFLLGARSAYQIIIEAFSNGDLKALKPLLTETVYTNFKRAMEEQKAEGMVTKTTIETIERSDVDAIDIVDHQARVTIRFRSRQIIVSQKVGGEIVENPAEISIPITDIWTFTRPLNDKNPNWLLMKTASESYRD
jgi:predicted lipid-binding transport protein (Tim44 family)